MADYIHMHPYTLPRGSLIELEPAVLPVPLFYGDLVGFRLRDKAQMTNA